MLIYLKFMQAYEISYPDNLTILIGDEIDMGCDLG